VLRLQKDHKVALLNRAIAELRSARLDEARQDYRDFLQRFSSTNYQSYYGLGEIAYQQGDWRAARENYEQYLRFAPSNSGEAGFVRTRLEEVKKEKP
jgi:TolA-binding protein